MATFVLCHGGWAGGWQWKEVASLLRAADHEVFTPTFTGHGERVHLARPDDDLDTYIRDILMVLKYEDLHDVILLGYSMSGIVITGVAEKDAERIQHLVYLDAYVPEDGQSFADLLGLEIMADLNQAAQMYGDGWRVPHDSQDADRYADRHTDQPINFVKTRLKIENPTAASLPRTLIYCTQSAQDIGPLHLPITKAAEQAESDGRWGYYELNTGHTPMWDMPHELTDILLKLV